MTKTQKQMIALGLIVAAGIGALIYFYGPSAGTSAPAAQYEAKKVDTGFSGSVFDNPEYPQLTTPVHLPIEPGPLGKKNPFVK